MGEVKGYPPYLDYPKPRKPLTYNLRLMWITDFDKWLNREPPIWRVFAWRRWKRERPVWMAVGASDEA